MVCRTDCAPHTDYPDAANSYVFYENDGQDAQRALSLNNYHKKRLGLNSNFCFLNADPSLYPPLQKRDGDVLTREIRGE